MGTASVQSRLDDPARPRSVAATPIRPHLPRMPPPLPPSIGADDLCHPTSERWPFTRAGWIFELKHDGFRALARRGPYGVQLLSRRGRPMSAAFPEIVDALAKLTIDVTLDGELVVPTADGRSDFEELRRRSLLQRPRLID